MEIGSRVRCIDSDGYHSLTKGKVYEVVDFQPRVRDVSGFTFPPYVIVIGDFGTLVTCHLWRFVTSEGNP